MKCLYCDMLAKQIKDSNYTNAQAITAFNEHWKITHDKTLKRI